MTGHIGRAAGDICQILLIWPFMLADGRLIEVQMSAEGATYSRAQMNELLDLAEKGVSELVAAQLAAVG